jgi:sugar phosphate permease
VTAAVDAKTRDTAPKPRIHRAWWVAAVILGALVAAAGFRSSTGALLEPLESEFGWSRSTTSGAVTANLVLYGLTAPFAAALMERFGIRRVVAASLLLVAAGSGLTVLMTAAWQLWLLWGLAVGIGTGAMALVLGAIVANRWFVESRRGLVTGVFSAAGAAGQLVFLPGIAALAEGPGWRYAALVVTVAAVLLVPLVLVVVRDHPQDVGLRPLGVRAESAATEESVAAGAARGEPVDSDGRHPSLQADGTAGPAPRHTSAARMAVETLVQSTRSRTFWVLFGTFWICGWSTNGLIGTHFIPAAHDHGMPQTTAAGLLALIGVFDIVGTVASGWLTDKVDPRWLLFGYYGLRGLSLLFVPALLGPDIHPNLFLFIVFYGLDWVATVPPTIALCRRHFGVARSGVVFGWVFASHMVGAGVAASYAGWVRSSTGDYQTAWLTAGALCVVAAFACLAIAKTPSRGSWHEAGEESEVASVA